MHIKSSSEHWRKYHNLLLSSEFKLNKNMINIEDKLNKNMINIEESSVRAISKIYEDPQFLSNHKEQRTKNLIFAIDLTDEKPFKCYILTSPENEQEYKQNKHYDGITSVEIISGEKADKVIRDFFGAFDSQRQLSR